MGAGVERLRVARGRQRVTFGDVADHLVDYIERHPGDAAVVERVAEFLADVEQVEHDHGAETAGGGLTVERG